MSTDRPKRTLKEELASRVFYDHSSGKNQERHILEGFLARLQLTSYEVEDSERPDFRIIFGNGTVVVGCELTLFSADFDVRGKKGGSMERRLHSQWEKFATSLRSELDKNGLLFIYGAVHFKNRSYNIFDQVDLELLQKEIVHLCSRVDVARNASKSLDIFDDTDYPTLNSFADRLYLRDCYPETGILWWCGHLQSGEIAPGQLRHGDILLTPVNKIGERPVVSHPEMTEALVRHIAAKAAKASCYEWNQAAQKWLLVYAANTGLKDLAFVADDPEIVHRITRVPFDAVFLWNKFSEDITELYPHFRTVMSGNEKALYVNRIPSVIRTYLKPNPLM